MKTIAKLILLVIGLSSINMAFELPDRGGKFGTVSIKVEKIDTTEDTINITKLNKTQNSSRKIKGRSSRCKPYVLTALKVRHSNYGVAGKIRAYPATRIGGCNNHRKIKIITRLCGGRTMGNVTRYNTSYYRHKSSYYWVGSKPSCVLSYHYTSVNGKNYYHRLRKGI